MFPYNIYRNTSHTHTHVKIDMPQNTYNLKEGKENRFLSFPHIA